MKLKMDKFYLLCTAIEVMKSNGVRNMAKYVWDLESAITNDRQFFAEQLRKIEKKYGKINEECEEFQEMINSETSDLPLLSKEKKDLLDEYPFLPLQYGLMLEFVEKEEEKENGNI